MMTMLNQAHVEAICSATYLENYLDCVDTLPDDLQRILTQIREVDVQLTELEKDATPFEEMFANLNDNETPDSKFVHQLQRMLLRMQELEDEKIQLSNSLTEFIENRTKQLEADRENLDPANHMINDTPATKSQNTNNKKNGNETKASSAVQSSASAHSVDSNKDSHKQTEYKPPTNSAKKRKKPETPAATSKSSAVTSRSNQSTANNHNNGTSTTASNHKDDSSSAKKQSSTFQEEVKATSKLPTKRKRRSRAGVQSKNHKEIAKAPSPDPEEPTYCLCNQISYGEMIGCDNDVCPIEWFHFNCVHLINKPKGKWYCPKCRGDKATVMRRGADKIR